METHASFLPLPTVVILMKSQSTSASLIGEMNWRVSTPWLRDLRRLRPRRAQREHRTLQRKSDRCSDRRREDVPRSSKRGHVLEEQASRPLQRAHDFIGREYFRDW